MNALIHIIHPHVSIMLTFQVRPDIRHSPTFLCPPLWNEYRLQRNQTVLRYLWLRGIVGCCVSQEDAFCRWSWRWVTGARATGFVVGLVCRVVDKAVGSRLAAVFNIESQLCGGQGPVDTVYMHTESVRV